MELPKRKANRLKQYDYSSNGAYFVTICIHNHKCLLGTVGASIARPNDVLLSTKGQIVEDAILNIPKKYSMINVDNYVVMPNHVHLLLTICNEDGRPMVAPTISQVIQQLKGIVTKQIGYSIWQKLFHDHVIRNKNDYEMIWQYIETNPQNWENDCFYT